LESKVFELLSVYLSEILELSILASTYIAISRSDRESIIEAKRIIDSQLALAPSCEELARKVNISTSKLSKGFSSLFGTSVHAYIIDQRLEKAASLLLESNLNVSQVAAFVGYSKPSNFAAAFKKKYGVIPKNYKNPTSIKKKGTQIQIKQNSSYAPPKDIRTWKFKPPQWTDISPQAPLPLIPCTQRANILSTRS